MIKVSLILPSLNVKKYIKECVESARQQTLQELEILCIDAGSTDGTWEILEQEAAKDSRIRLIRSEMKSYGHQVNMGLELARGDYVGILETDDYVEPTMYETLYDVAAEQMLDVVKAGFYFFKNKKQSYAKRERKAFVGKCRVKYREVVEKPAGIYELFAEDCQVWTGLYRRQFLLAKQIRCSETPGAAFQDIGFVLQSLYLADRVMYLPDCFYNYRIDRMEASTYNLHVLSYCRAEYARSKTVLQKNGIQDMTGYYIRLASSFLYEYRKVLRAVDFDTESSWLTETIDWFWHALEEGRQGGWFTEDRIEKNTLENILLFLQDREAFSEKIKEELLLYHKEEKQMKKKVGHAPIVIYGAGVRGKKTLECLDNLSMETTVIADRNQKLWGTRAAGVEILDPQECVKRYRDAFFFVANRYQSEEIVEWLQSQGVDPERIYVNFFSQQGAVAIERGIVG